MHRDLTRSALGSLALTLVAALLAACGPSAEARQLDVTYYYLPG